MPFVMFNFHGKSWTALKVCQEKITANFRKVFEDSKISLWCDHWGNSDDDRIFYAVEKQGGVL